MLPVRTQAVLWPLSIPIICRKLPVPLIRQLHTYMESISQVSNKNLPKMELKKDGCTAQLNSLFLYSYGIKKETIKSQLGIQSPVLVLHGDNLILLHKGEKNVTIYVPGSYHSIKDIAHISCIIHTLYWLKKNKPASNVEEMRDKCRSLIEKTLESIPEDSILKKYEELIKQYKLLLEEEEPKNLLQLKPHLEQLIKEAAQIRTLALHTKIEAIQEQISREDWNRLAIIVMGPRMPREGELGMQYARAMIMSPNGEKLSDQCPHQNEALSKVTSLKGKRLIYAESIDDIDKALDLLSTEICDEDLGEQLLGEGERMRSDFLKSAVQEYLGQLKEKKS